MIQDIRFAVRMFLRNRTFTVAVILCFALGIGANIAVFSVVNSLILRPLPFEKPERLVVIRDVMPNGYDPTLAPADYLELRDWNRSFEAMAGHTQFDVNLTGLTVPERLRAETVSPSFFEVFGVQPSLGRGFLPDEETVEVHEVVLSFRFWQERFGTDPDILGRTLLLDGRAHSVVGVAPASFRYPETAEIWVRSYRYGLPEPPAVVGDGLKDIRGAGYFRVVGRLAEDVSLGQAQEELNVIFDRLAKAERGDSGRIGMEIQPVHENMVGDIRPALRLLMGTVGFVLLIACANVVNLLLARSTARAREIAVRAALGVSRIRLVAQLLIENVLLGLVGGTVGLLFALWGINGLVRLAPAGLARTSEIGVDIWVLAFALGLSISTSIVFGLLPALFASKLDLQASLKEGGRSTGEGMKSRRVRGVLVVSEVVLSLILICGAGLLIKSLLKLQAEDPGFAPENLLVMRIDLPEARYDNTQKTAAFFREVTGRIDRAVGVLSAGAVLTLPFSGDSYVGSFEVIGRPLPNGERHRTGFQTVTPGYFRTMGIPLLSGRVLTDRDDADAPPVALINQSAARLFFPDEDAVGGRIRAVEEVEVVGVVGDVRHFGYGDPPRPEVFLSYLQIPLGGMALVVRTESNPESGLGAVREQVLAVDRDQALFDVYAMEELMVESTQRRRFTVQLLGLFAVLAIVLALVGIYGVMSYSISQRINEIGIRFALGADRPEILRLTLGWGLKRILAGTAIGLVMGLGFARFITGYLYGVSAADPAVLASASVLLVATGTLAAYLPSQRASRFEPVAALRHE